MARILIVDDEEQVRALLKRLLTLHGHVVEEAADGLLALERLKGKPFDLMILDRMMPKMSGVEVAAIVRTLDRYKTMKILMATSASVNKDVEEAFEAGVDGYVLKPFHLDQLLAKVEQTLKG